MSWIFDFELSFNDPSPGRSARALLDSKERKLLGSSVWEAADEAISAIFSHLPLDISAPPALAVREALPSLEDEVSRFFDYFFPDLLAAIRNGRLILLHGSAEELETAWPDFDAADRACLFLPFIEDNVVALSNGKGGMVEQVQLIAATCVILRTKLAALHALWGSRDVDRYVTEIVRFRRLVRLQEEVDKTTIGTKAAVLSQLGRDLAYRRHSDGNTAREWVQREWSTYRDQYAGNKSAFARAYVRRVAREKGVEVTEKQMRDVWLRYPPPARNPGGMPADG